MGTKRFCCAAPYCCSWKPPDALSAGLEIYALPSDPKTLAAALDYLRQNGLVELSHSRISSAHVRAKLTAEGRDYLESGGF